MDCLHYLHFLISDLVVDNVEDVRNKEKVKKIIRSAVMSKQYGNEDFLADLITEACISVIPEKANFNVDNVRVCKILVSSENLFHLNRLI